MQESLTDVITQTRDLHAQIQSGIAPEKDARELLADLGRQLAKLVGKIAPTKRGHDRWNRYRTAGGWSLPSC